MYIHMRKRERTGTGTGTDIYDMLALVSFAGMRTIARGNLCDMNSVDVTGRPGDLDVFLRTTRRPASCSAKHIESVAGVGGRTMSATKAR